MDLRDLSRLEYRFAGLNGLYVILRATLLLWMLIFVLALLVFAAQIFERGAFVDPQVLAALPGIVVAAVMVERFYVGVLNLHRGFAFIYLVVHFLGTCYLVYLIAPFILSAFEYRLVLDYRLIDFAVLIASIVIWLIYNVVVAVQLFVIASISSPSERVLLSAHQRSLFTSGGLLELFGVPSGFEYIRRYRILVLSLLVVSSFLFALTPLTVFAAGGFLNQVMGNIASIQSDGPSLSVQERAGEVLGDYADVLLAVYAFAPVLLFCGTFVGAQLRKQALSRFAAELSEKRGVDQRPPILFLRTFRDDQVTLSDARSSLMNRLLTFGRPIQKFDQLLYEEATPLGRVIAIGNPADKTSNLVPFGAERQYVEQNWEELVIYHMTRARAVVMVVDNSEGLWKEVREVLARKFYDKTLFIVHPSWRDPEQYQLILQEFVKVARASGAKHFDPLLELGARPGARRRRLVGFFVGSSNHLRVFESREYSWISALLLLRIFLRSPRFSKRSSTSSAVGSEAA